VRGCAKFRSTVVVRKRSHALRLAAACSAALLAATCTTIVHDERPARDGSMLYECAAMRGG
jgi:hypothetical protein